MNAIIFNQHTYKIWLQKTPFFFDCGGIPNTVIDSSQKHYIVVSHRGNNWWWNDLNGRLVILFPLNLFCFTLNKVCEFLPVNYGKLKMPLSLSLKEKLLLTMIKLILKLCFGHRIMKADQSIANWEVIYLKHKPC